jgi:hypothetical protein
MPLASSLFAELRASTTWRKHGVKAVVAYKQVHAHEFAVEQRHDTLLVYIPPELMDAERWQMLCDFCDAGLVEVSTLSENMIDETRPTYEGRTFSQVMFMALVYSKIGEEYSDDDDVNRMCRLLATELSNSCVAHVDDATARDMLGAWRHLFPFLTGEGHKNTTSLTTENPSWVSMRATEIPTKSVTTMPAGVVVDALAVGAADAFNAADPRAPTVAFQLIASGDGMHTNMRDTVVVGGHEALAHRALACDWTADDASDYNKYADDDSQKV